MKKFPLFKGIALCAILTPVPFIISAYLGGPYMVYALALGMILQNIIKTPQWTAGITFTGKKILRVGVALLGARITFDEIASLGFTGATGVFLIMIATILFGMILSEVLGLGRKMGILTGGATAICGASAALAISSVLPHDKKLEQQTLFTVVGVNIISTVVMILYPVLAVYFDFTDMQSGIFLGGAIHDVAQVVGAGLLMSDSVLDTATVTKLFRVAMLLPIVFAIVGIGIWISRKKESNTTSHTAPPFPVFLLAFLGFVTLKSIGILEFTLPTLNISMADGLAKTSKILLTMSIIALGMKTSLRSMATIGTRSIVLLIAETLFIGAAMIGLVFVL